MTCSRFAPLLAALLLASTAACDSGDPVDETGPEPVDVAGIYALTELTFRPTAQGVAPADVLATLDTSRTQLWLAGNGTFIFFYQFRGGAPYFLLGDFAVTAASVRLQGDDALRADYERILLDVDLVLDRDEDDADVLSSEVVKPVNLEAFDAERYASLTSVGGTLRLRFRKLDD
jgi:hypothetical protein